MYRNYYAEHSPSTQTFRDQKYYETQVKTLQQQGQYEEALENYDKLFQIWDSIPASDAHFNRIVYTYERHVNLLFQLGRPLEAVKSHRRLLEIEKRSYNGGTEYVPYHETGKKLLDLGIYEEALDLISQTHLTSENARPAIDFYNQVIQLNPSLARTYNLKGKALRQLNQEAEAQECFQTFARLSLGPRGVLNDRNPESGEEEKAEEVPLINASSQIVRSEESPQNLTQNSQINLISNDPRNDNAPPLRERLSHEPQANSIEDLQRIEPQISLQAGNYQMRPTFRRVPIDKLLLLKQRVALKLGNRPGQVISEGSQREVDNFDSLIRLNPLNQKSYYEGAKYCFKKKLYMQANHYIEKALEIGANQQDLNHDISETSSFMSVSDTESIISSSNLTIVSNADLRSHLQMN